MGILTSLQIPSFSTAFERKGHVFEFPSVHEIITNRHDVVTSSADILIPGAVRVMELEDRKSRALPTMFTGTRVEHVNPIKNELGQPATTTSERSDRQLNAQSLVAAALTNGKQDNNTDFLEMAHHIANIDDNPEEALTLAA